MFVSFSLDLLDQGPRQASLHLPLQRSLDLMPPVVAFDQRATPQ